MLRTMVHPKRSRRLLKVSDHYVVGTEDRRRFAFIVQVSDGRLWTSRPLETAFGTARVVIRQ
jgi:hypothetical protein